MSQKRKLTIFPYNQLFFHLQTIREREREINEDSIPQKATNKRRGKFVRIGGY